MARENFETMVNLIKDIDFQKTQLMFNLYEMFDIDKHYNLEFDLNPFCNNIYFFDGFYELEIIKTKAEYPDMYIFNESGDGNSLLETPSFQCCDVMVRNDNYVGLKNSDGDWLVLSRDKEKSDE